MLMVHDVKAEVLEDMTGDQIIQMIIDGLHEGVLEKASQKVRNDANKRGVAEWTSLLVEAYGNKDEATKAVKLAYDLAYNSGKFADELAVMENLVEVVAGWAPGKFTQLQEVDTTSALGAKD